MTTSDLQRALDELDGAYPMTLDPKYDGGCPCFRIRTTDGVSVWGHCWRICHDCEYSGVHVTGPDTPAVRQLGETLQRLLTAMDWYGEWALQFEPDR